MTLGRFLEDSASAWSLPGISRRCGRRPWNAPADELAECTQCVMMSIKDKEPQVSASIRKRARFLLAKGKSARQPKASYGRVKSTKTCLLVCAAPPVHLTRLACDNPTRWFCWRLGNSTSRGAPPLHPKLSTPPVKYISSYQRRRDQKSKIGTQWMST